MDLARIELRHLRYFLAVADAAHFTRAAERLHVTQPTLSHQIRQLEGQLDLSLFDRVGRQVRLTAAGELLLPFARRAFRELEEAQTALGELHGLKRGRLRVGIVQTVNACVIPEIVARFSAEFPGIEVQSAELAVAEIESGLESGRIDLGISFMPATSAKLEGEKLFTEELVAVLPGRHSLAKKRELTVRELAAVPLVLLAERYCTRQLVDGAFSAAGVRPRVQVEMNSIESILATVEQAGLASVLPELAMCRERAGLVARPLAQPKPRRSVGLLWLRGARRRRAAEAFEKITRTVLAQRKVGR
jgi:LysR family transcriptional regulator, cyn operon transcriptional activator